jgi:hypothetical protein
MSRAATPRCGSRAYFPAGCTQCQCTQCHLSYPALVTNLRASASHARPRDNHAAARWGSPMYLEAAALRWSQARVTLNHLRAELNITRDNDRASTGDLHWVIARAAQALDDLDRCRIPHPSQSRINKVQRIGLASMTSMRVSRSTWRSAQRAARGPQRDMLGQFAAAWPCLGSAGAGRIR